MRGLITIIRNAPPDLAAYQHGLIILSCTNAHKELILSRLKNWMPHLSWSILQREEYYPEGEYTEILTSLTSETVAQRLVFLRNLRKKDFDVCVMTWTGEPSYGLLKLLALLSNAHCFIVINENGDGFIFNRSSWSIVHQHWNWRRQGGHTHGIGRELLEILSWIFLFPLGFVYLVFRTTALTVAKWMKGPE
ncbi:MAG: hypothetical protein V1799_21685 [bacterium]